MEELPITLHGCRALVIGYGRLGKLLSHRLDALGARTSVSARKWADLAWAEAFGYGVEQTERLDGWLCGYDLIINTVPARVLGRERLTELKQGCLVIDLASKPGGAGVEMGPAAAPRLPPGRTAGAGPPRNPEKRHGSGRRPHRIGIETAGKAEGGGGQI